MSGCHGRFLIFILALSTVIIIAFFLVHRQFGGKKGANYWMAAHAFSAVSDRLLENLPAGISKSEISAHFALVDDAISEEKIDLDRLSIILREHQSKFQNNDPSVEEIVNFVDLLLGTIISDAVP